MKMPPPAGEPPKDLRKPQVFPGFRGPGPGPKAQGPGRGGRAQGPGTQGPGPGPGSRAGVSRHRSKNGFSVQKQQPFVRRRSKKGFSLQKQTHVFVPEANTRFSLQEQHFVAEADTFFRSRSKHVFFRYGNKTVFRCGLEFVCCCPRKAI